MKMIKSRRLSAAKRLAERKLVLEGFASAPKIKDRASFATNSINWAENSVSKFNMRRSDDEFNLKPEYKALFLETCPKNSLWTEVSPNMIGYKLTKVFYERAYAGLEPLAMESMMRFP